MGFRTAAMALSGSSISIEEPRLAQAERLAVLLGSEGNGLSPETIACCDDTVRIPMAHGVDSSQRGRRRRRGLLAAAAPVSLHAARACHAM